MRVTRSISCSISRRVTYSECSDTGEHSSSSSSASAMKGLLARSRRFGVLLMIETDDESVKKAVTRCRTGSLIGTA